MDRNRAPCAAARRNFIAFSAGWLGGAALPASAQNLAYEDLDTPFVTTPQNVVDAMLELAGVGAGDVLLDLGSGDGRIVITAAQRFGVRGTGVEIDPRLVARARASAAAAGVADRVRFLEQDLFTTDLSGASVITIYLLPAVNLKLRPALQRLKPGTRIVSHDWGMGDWPPDREIVVPAPTKTTGLTKSSTLMLWTIR
ncbi:MAG: methyltransferase domain-containing protein [Burkholderiales bacterium]|nr:methyltransferase domain-containing protein [Burkholderiales bacterium]